ncbi:hypothetical protein SOVF_193430 [Spinacia oleracea]|uniref:BZIP transcription factor 17 n=1 Tax=Spinacia oleracea TaxID=3562 RepID=A0A9R0I099_SPIOL|nr:bZIP transcription factor 17 [Spinacia oleracea]KNA05108.1 hypothetical protein SOVF_193430 [Spinacia oleracea]
MEDPIPYDPNPSPLPIPPLDNAHLHSTDFFPENFSIDADGYGGEDDDFNFGVDFDFTFDDLCFADDLLSDPQVPEIPNSDVSDALENPNSGDSEIIGNPAPRVYDCSSPEVNPGPISSEESNFGVKLSCASPESGSCKSNSAVSQTFRGDSGNNSDRDVSSSSFVDNNDDLSPNSQIKVEEIVGKSNHNVNNTNKKNGVPKRKKEHEYEHEQVEERSSEGRLNKFRRSSMSENMSIDLEGVDGDDKKKARLMRNRESAQLSRQRKKQYVEELEDKVRAMHSTITDLNGKISYMMAENASLRHQLVGGGMCAAPPPPHGMYPMAPMPYPWMACPPYMVKQQGSHVPLVPIPRLKPQQPAPAPKVNRRSESKKSEGKTKKVASVSLLGLLFCMLLFGGLVPLVNVKYGGLGIGFDGVQKGSVFMVDKHMESKISSHGRILKQTNSSDRLGPNGNSSEPLVASLYVPRNDKLVKIDGNLIIHSVLASEKAKAKQTAEGIKTSEETGLAIHGSYPPYPIPGPGSNDWRHPHLDRNQNGRQRALSSSSSEEFTPAGSDGKLQEWFREGLAGPMLSSGMCTEVFQFDISPTPGAIVPATSIVNITSERRQNSTRPNRSRNRRILHEHAIPLDGNTLNATEDHVQHEHSDGLQGNKSSSSMVVSVLVDPREIGDGDGEGVIRSKTMSRIFVVVLIDSVKYVTYSCMLPFMGSGNHLVTT